MILAVPPLEQYHQAPAPAPAAAAAHMRALEPFLAAAGGAEEYVLREETRTASRGKAKRAVVLREGRAGEARARALAKVLDAEAEAIVREDDALLFSRKGRGVGYRRKREEDTAIKESRADNL